MDRAQRHAVGCVRFDRCRGTWNYLFYDHGRRRSKLIGTKRQYPTKAAAWRAVELLQIQARAAVATEETVRDVSTRYQAERMPTRLCTARVYTSFLDNHVLPKWGDTLIRDVQPRAGGIVASTIAARSKVQDARSQSAAFVGGLRNVGRDSGGCA
jgi:hypothetical protein